MNEPSQAGGPRKFGEYLACSDGAIRAALARQVARAPAGMRKRLGEILIEAGIITQEDLDIAIRKQRVDRLRQCYVFASLSLPELTALSARFGEVTVPAGHQFIIQDMEDPALYVLAAGHAEVYRVDLDGNKLHIAELGPGEPIGEMGYFQGGIRTASVRAIEDCELLRAEYKDLTFYFEKAPKVALAFTRLVEQRRLATQQLMEEEQRKREGKIQ
jgi:CRP-like cAMP-binding protein